MSGNIYKVFDLDCNADSARNKVSNLIDLLRSNPEKYLPYFKLGDIEKYLRKEKLEKIKK